MKNILIGLALFSIAFNVYFHGTWIYAFVNTETHAGAVSMSKGFFPSILSLNLLSALGPLLTLVSFVVFSNLRTAKNYYFHTTCMVIQVAFMVLYIWQKL